MKTLTMDRYDPAGLSAYLANGLIGLRVPQIPLQRGRAFVQGYAGPSPEFGVEAMLPVPYPLGIDIQINSDWAMRNRRAPAARFQKQLYDLSCGELTSRFVVQLNGITAEIEVITFCSRTQPAVCVQRTAVEVSEPCDLVLRAAVDLGDVPGELIERVMPGRRDTERSSRERDAIIHWRGTGDRASLGVSYDSFLDSGDLKNRARNDFGHEKDCALTNYSLDARPGERYVMDQFAGLVPGAMHEEPHWQANRMVANATWFGFEELRENNAAAWGKLWKGRPVLVGAPDRWQEISDSSFFYTHSSIHPSSIKGIAPFGLSHENYHGHIFWDYETFMYPGVLMTSPEAARASMEYRYECLPRARQNAKLHGFRGVQFPWQSGNSGAEVTSYYCSAREYHINPAVACAMGQFAHATGDELFTREKAWPVLKGVARWIESFVVKTDRGYETCHFASPNEQYHDVDNDAQMHLFISAALREAIWCAEHLGYEAPGKWREIRENLYMPTRPGTDVVTQFEGFDGGVSVGPMYGLFPLGVSYGEDMDEATYEDFMDDLMEYAGMPMSSSYLAVWAARRERRAEAVKLLEKGIASRVVEPFDLMVEAAPTPDRPSWLTRRTCFVTGQGGLLTSIVLGFPGLQLRPGSPGTWRQHEAALPEGWESVEIERIWAHGRPARLRCRHGEKAEMEFLD